MLSRSERVSFREFVRSPSRRDSIWGAAYVVRGGSVMDTNHLSGIFRWSGQIFVRSCFVTYPSYAGRVSVRLKVRGRGMPAVHAGDLSSFPRGVFGGVSFYGRFARASCSYFGFLP